MTRRRLPPPDQHGEPRARVNIRDGLILATYRLVLLHVLYIPIIEATATSTAPGVAWIMVGKQRARRDALGFLRRDRGLLVLQRGTSRQNPNLPASAERLLY